MNENWECFKAKQCELLSAPETGQIYVQRKIDVEPIFGKMKAFLRFRRFSVRGFERVTREVGIVVVVLNIMKPVTLGASLKNKRLKQTVSLNTLQSYKTSLIHFKKYLVDVSTENLTRNQIQQFLNKLDLSYETARKALMHIQACLWDAVSDGVIPRNPADG